MVTRFLVSLLVLAAVVGFRPGYAAEFSVDPARECKRLTPNPVFDPSGKESYEEYYRRIDRSRCWKEWLIIVYMAADNDLSPYSFRDLWEMEGMGSSASVDVVVFQDSLDEDGLRYFHMAKRPTPFDYKGQLKAFVKKEGLENEDAKAQEEAFLNARGLKLLVSPRVKELPEGDSGAVETAGAFLEWALSHYPSHRINLIGWSHGEGFDARAAADFNPGGKQGGFAFDETSKDHMAVTQMAAGLGAMIRKYRKGVPLDIAGSDACLNQQVEFGYEWVGVSDYVFGSSTIVQKKGFNYRQLLELFIDRPLKPTWELAKQIPVIYGKSVSAGATGPYSSYRDPDATMAVWTSAELKPLVRALNDLGKYLRDYMIAPKDPVDKLARQDELKEVIGKTVRLGGVSNDLFNFIQVVEHWVSEKKTGSKKPALWESIAGACNSVRETLRRAVLEKFIGESFRKGLLTTSQGVAIWLPTSRQEYKEMLPKFMKSQLYRSGGADPDLTSDWASFIKQIYAE